MNNGLRVTAREERIKEYILPSRIVATGGDVENAESLLREKELQILLDESDVCRAGRSGFLILDFGKEIHGGVRLLVHTCTGNANVRIRFGESVAECCSEVGASGATNDHSMRDFLVPVTFLSDMEWGQSGFRFVRIDTMEDGAVCFKSILATFVRRDLKPEGSFVSSDERLNTIFDTAAYTLELNMQHHLWDGIKRDRLVWMGDIHPETKGIISLFGADPCVEQALDLLREKTPIPRFINNMPSYSMWYLIIAADYYFQNGNAGFVKKQEKYIVELVRYLAEFVDEMGRINIPEYFLDWPSFQKMGAEAGVNALFELCMKKSRILLEVLGKREPKLDVALGRLNRNLPDGDLKQVIAFRSLAGHADRRESAERLAREGAKGFSTFMSYYIGRAMFEGGRGEEAIRLLREYYGAMLDRGATTFWEDFSMDWLEGSSRIDEMPKAGEKDLHGGFGAHCYVGFRHSFCHGWSCGVVPFLTEFVLGVRVVEAGCKRVEIAPCLGDLEWVRGTYPTPMGLISVEHRKKGDGIVSRVEAPEGVEVFCRTLA